MDHREPLAQGEQPRAWKTRLPFSLATLLVAALIVDIIFRWTEEAAPFSAMLRLPYTVALCCAIALTVLTGRIYFRYRSLERTVELETEGRKRGEKLREDMEDARDRVEREENSNLKASCDFLRSLCSAASRQQVGSVLLDYLQQSLPYDVFAILQDSGESLDLSVISRAPLGEDLVRQLRGQVLEAYGRANEGHPISVPLSIRLERCAASGGDLSPTGMHIICQVPLRCGDGGAPVGILFVGSTGGPRTATTADMGLLEAIADDVAIALQRCAVVVAPEQQNFARVVEQLPEGMILLNGEGSAMLLNPAAEEYIGILGGEITEGKLERVGKYSLRELLAPPPIGKLHHELEVSFPVRRVFEVEARPMEMYPPVQGRLLVLREVTRDREVQQRVLQQEQLAAIGQLASGIAHDFNNLLMGMIGFGQLLQLRPGMSENSKRDLEQIVGLGQKAANLVRQVLDFSRKSVSQRTPFDLSLFVKETTKFLQRTIPESIHISLDTTPDPSGYLVEADPAQIRQVIMNLALNSRDAMPQGGELLIRLSRLTIKSANERPVADLPPGEWLQLSISDTGTGISKETMQHIFEPFFTTKDVGRGTGLGMAQVYGIIKQHNGSIDVKSTEGQGATVSIFLPVFEQSVEEPEIETDAEIHRGKGETIMLVEDERELLALGVQMIESLGYAVIPASNGNQALSVYKERSSTIALVITDMVMPDIGGLELLRELAIINPRLKAIVLSGYSLEEDKNKLYSRGIVDQIQKPVNIAQMARSIHQAIKNSGVEQPCRPQQGEPLL